MKIVLVLHLVRNRDIVQPSQYMISGVPKGAHEMVETLLREALL